MSKSTEKKVSFLDKLQEIQNEHEKHDDDVFYNHVAICLEVGDDGFPKGKMIHIKGQPYEVLGLIELAMMELQSAKDKVLARFDVGHNNELTESTSEKNIDFALERGLGNAPKFVKRIINSYTKELSEALSNGDKKELARLRGKIQEDIQNYMEKHGLSDEDISNINDDDDNSDDDKNKNFGNKKGFDINDFK